MDPSDHSPSVDPSRWVEAHGDALYAYALRRLGDAGEAEDAVQDCLLAALGAARSFRGDSAERTWLTGILKHKVLDALRARYRRKEHAADLAEMASAPLEDFSDGFWRVHQQGWAMLVDQGMGATPLGSMERAEFARRVARAVERLPEPMRSVLVLREVDGLSSAELGEALGVSASQVWTLVHRAKARLRRELDGAGEGGDA
ncbi:MAG: sigma-70 family RNA polymerase sigma factor [Phycisphaerales bacterium]|jgi:RNA polymerase sigma factor (sigma-70 family)